MRKYVTLRQAAELLPIKVHMCALWRWCAKGVHVRTINEIVRLQHVYVGRGMLTAELWLEEFIDRLTAARMAERQWQAGGRPGRKWQRYAELREADIVVSRVTNCANRAVNCVNWRGGPARERPRVSTPSSRVSASEPDLFARSARVFTRNPTPRRATK